MLLLGDPTDPNACEMNDNCINLCFNGKGKISADSLRGDVASPLVLGIYGCSTVVLICFTCPAITVVTVILWALDGVRGRALGWLGPGSSARDKMYIFF